MNKDDYMFIRQLAWTVLIDSKIDKLPVELNKIVNYFDIDTRLSFLPLNHWSKCRMLSKTLLRKFGLECSVENAKLLSVRILAPAVILYECNVKSAKEISEITKLPEQEAAKRFDRLNLLKKREKFYTSEDETTISNNFRDFVASYRSNRP